MGENLTDGSVLHADASHRSRQYCFRLDRASLPFFPVFGSDGAGFGDK